MNVSQWTSEPQNRLFQQFFCLHGPSKMTPQVSPKQINLMKIIALSKNWLLRFCLIGCQLGQKAAHHKRQLPANYGPVTHERTKAKIVKNEFNIDKFFLQNKS